MPVPVKPRLLFRIGDCVIIVRDLDGAEFSALVYNLHKRVLLLPSALCALLLCLPLALCGSGAGDGL